MRFRPLVLALFALAALPAGAAADSWGAAAVMPSSRFDHSALLLPSGKVLVTAGGMTGRSSIGTTVLYDPAANVWLGAPDLTPGRDNQMASLLQDGDALVTGGEIAGPPASVTTQTATFQSATNSWRPFTPSMPDPHAEGTQTTLADGRVLVAGGFPTGVSLSDLSGIATTAADVYDPTSDSWTRAASLPSGHARDQAVLLKDETVLVAGGASRNTLATAVRYDPATDTWSDAGTMGSPRRNFTATLLPDGRVLVVGGTGIRSTMDGSKPTWSSAELYDPTTNSWSDAAPMATPRAEQTATLLQSGKVLVVGGNDGRGLLASSELYDPATDSWSSAGSLVVPRYDHTATLLQDGRVLIAGGFGATGSLDTAELYTPDPPAGGGGSGGQAGGGGGGGGGTPGVSSLALSATRFRAASSGPSVTAVASKRRAPVGTTISYRDGAAATSTFAVQKPAAGRKASGRCVKPNRGNRHRRACTRWVTIGHFAHADTAGPNSLRFSGRLNRHKLSPGSYRLSISARVGRGRASAAKTIGFRIVG